MDSVAVNNIQKENFQRICRSCLTEAIFGNMFEMSYDQVLLATMLKEILLIEIDPNDEMPKNLCERCIDEVVESYNFRKRFDESQSVLKKILESEEIKPETENCEAIKLLNSEIKCTTQDSLEFIRVPVKFQSENKLEIFKIFDPQISTESSSDTRSFSLKVQRNSMCLTPNLVLDKKTRQNLRKLPRKKPKLYKCVCGVNFVRWTEYVQHNRETRHNISPQMCKICNKKFSPRNLRLHMIRVHMPNNDHERKHMCEYCGKRYFSRDAVINHSLRHREKIHPCDSCDRKFAILHEYERHRREHINKQSYICEYCGLVYTTEHKFLKHKESHVRELPLDCKICKKVFQSVRNLRQHQYNVHREKNLLCVKCGETFSRHSSLRVHMRKHTGERPYQCNYCDKNFRLLSCYKHHILAHTAEKRHKCDICSKSFLLKHHLTRHVRLHTGEKHKKCMFCEYSAFNNQDLKKHLWKHTGENPLQCKVCGRKCVSFKQLKEHQEAVHGVVGEKEIDVASFFNFNK